MNNFLEYIGMIGIESGQQMVTGLVRLFLAAVLGAVIGIEREKKHRPAGLRTHMLVCVASALVMITNEQLIQAYGTGDPTRMGAQVISGIGFLGAGTILTDRQNRIRGLTTAAGLWASACVGLAVGGGFYIGGIATCVLMMVIFTKFIEVEQRFVRKSLVMEINVVFDGPKNMNHFISDITVQGCSILSFEYVDLEDLKAETDIDVAGYKKKVCANMHILLPGKRIHQQILEMLEGSKGLIHMEEL